MIQDNVAAIVLVLFYLIASAYLFYASSKEINPKRKGKKSMSDALLDVQYVNGIPVKVSFTNDNPPWWICAGGNNPVVSFKMHQDDFELGKNGCEIEDLLTATCIMLTRQVLNRECYNDPRIQTAIEHIEAARKQLMIHGGECLKCSPGIKHVR